MKNRFILITGCSSGGKSSLLKALSEQGFATIQEPGRRIVIKELASDGAALPWTNMKAFALHAIEMAKADLSAAHTYDGFVFFDRGLIDAAVALENSGGQSISQTLGEVQHYQRQVFVAPPWKELFFNDAERRHDFSAAVQEHARIISALLALGYAIKELPKASVQERVEFVLSSCEES